MQHLFSATVMALGAASCEARSGHAAHTEALVAHARTWKPVKSVVCNGAHVTTIDNFLPPEIAAEWHGVLNETWQRSAPCRERGESNCSL